MNSKLSVFFLFCFVLSLLAFPAKARHNHRGCHPTGSIVWGQVVTQENGKPQPVDYATVYLKGSASGGTTNERGRYRLKAPAGDYTLTVSAIGYDPFEQRISLKRGEPLEINVTLTPKNQELAEVTVVSTGVSRVQRSAYNTVAVDTREMRNSTKNLSDALAKAPA